MVDRRSIGRNPTAFSTDVADFRAALQAAAGLGPLRPRAETLDAAVAQYTGELLPALGARVGRAPEDGLDEQLYLLAHAETMAYALSEPARGSH